jgi:hypothetical protein
LTEKEPLPRLAAQQGKGGVTRWTELARLGDAPEFAAALIRLAELALEPRGMTSKLALMLLAGGAPALAEDDEA